MKEARVTRPKLSGKFEISLLLLLVCSSSRVPAHKPFECQITATLSSVQYDCVYNMKAYNRPGRYCWPDQL